MPRLLSVRNGRFGGPLTPDDLADLSQDVLLVVLRKLDQYLGESSLDGWLYRIAALEFMNGLRRRRRQATLVDGDVPDVPDPTRQHGYDDVHESLGRIDEKDAEVIRLKHFEDLTFGAIGLRLGVSPSTAKARYYRGLRALEPMLDERRPATS